MRRHNRVLTPKQRIQAELDAVVPAATSSRPAGSFQLPLECRRVLPIKLHSSPPVVRFDRVLTIKKRRCVWFLPGFRRFGALSRPLTVTVVAAQTHTVAAVNVHRMNGEQCGRQLTSKPTRRAGGRLGDPTGAAAC